MSTEQQEQEAAKDLAERVEAFNAEFTALLGKYRLGVGAQAFLLLDGRIGSKPVVVDADQAQGEEGLAKAE